MFSKTCEYAIRAMLFIAQQTKNGERIGIRKIAKGIDSPEHFIAKILQELSRKGIVQSAKGPNGGFYLDKAGATQSLASIVKAVDGDHLFKGCGLGLRQCSETHPCPLHPEFKKIRQQLSQTLEKATVGNLSKQLHHGKSFLKLN